MRLAGFTYIEVLLTVALMVLVAFFASPFYGDFVYERSMDIVEQTVQMSFAKAQIYSMTGMRGDAWGVTTHGNTMVVYKGDAYGTREEEYDEVYQIEEGIAVIGLNEVIFERRTGLPNAPGMFRITRTDTNATWADRVVTLNALGVITIGH